MEKISLKMQLIILAALGILLFFGGTRYQKHRLDSLDFQVGLILSETPAVEVQAEPPPKLISVHIVGAVEREGVFTFTEGARVNEAVEIAGPKAGADLSQINLAAPLEDGRQLYVPAKGEKVAERSTFAVVKKEDGLININTAGPAELERLPGIGPALAERIIAYRQKNGEFTGIEGITKVSGIGPAVFEKVKGKIKVR